ncbi:MAG: GHMP kinase [Deltaproteobacteria bacterium]|nr:GHMP kinase [Deltaproteobacteria bacterium]
MIISRTPLRISFVGGGSDLAAFYSHEPGAVVATTITKYVYIMVNPKFDRRIRASYSRTEIVDRVDDLEHELIRESLRATGIDGAIEITSISDIPSRGTGLGSSSAYTVGLLNALYAYRGLLASADRLADEACTVEIDRCGKSIGKQDQYMVAYGGLKYIAFTPDGNVLVTPILCSTETRRQLCDNLLLLYTGQTRLSDDVLPEQAHNLRVDPERRAAVRRMVDLADQMRDQLAANRIDDFGALLHENWMVKRTLASNVSNPAIDAAYNLARLHGALGGKILGAGGGGFLLLYAPPERHSEICRALELPATRVRFEPHGSRLIYVEDHESTPV